MSESIRTNLHLKLPLIKRVRPYFVCSLKNMARFLLSVLVTFVLCALMECYDMEEPCSRAGGQCLPVDECPVAIEKQYLNLCPKQKSEGIECCHGISTKTTICQNRGGACMEWCNPDLRDTRATDCGDLHCCMLV